MTETFRVPTEAEQKFLFDFEADHGDRLVGLLRSNSQLIPAARMAGRQLEWLSPSVMGSSAKGFFAGKVIHAPVGGMLFVFADARRVATIHVHLPPEHSARDFIADTVRYTKEIYADFRKGRELDWHEATVATMCRLLELAGGAPGVKGKYLDPERTTLILGALLAALSEDAQANVAGILDQTRQAEICPACVGLVGPASNGNPDCSSGQWPIILPLGPYLAAAVDESEANGMMEPSPSVDAGE